MTRIIIEGLPQGRRTSLGLPRPHPKRRDERRSAGTPRNPNQGQRAGDPAAASRRKETMPRQTLRIRDDNDLRTVFECFDLDESGTVDVRVIPEMIRTLMYEVPEPRQVQDLLARYDADGSGSLDFSEFQALLQDYESPYDIWIEQTQEELGLVLRNRKDGHVCIVSVCPELCPALYEAARRGVMVPGHRIASIDGQWLGAGNELEFDVVAAMASSRDHSDAVAAVRESTTVSRRRRFTQVNDIKTRARRRTTCGERSGSSACSSRSRRPSRFRAGATTSRCPGGSTPCS